MSDERGCLLIARPKKDATERVDLQRLRYVPALDGIRAFAVLFVMSYHLTEVFAPRKYLRGGPVPGGFLGVDLFFVLSGFLITSLLLGEQSTTGRISLRGFYRRRALRLLPALVAMLFVHLLYTALTGLPLAIEIHSIIAVILYVANWYMTTGHRVAAGLRHLWSLSVEEQFYAIWPVITIVVLGVRRSLRFTIAALLATVLALALWRAWLWDNGAHASGLIGFRTDGRADGLLLGALAGYLWTWRAIPKHGLRLAASVSAILVVVCVAYIKAGSSFYIKGGYTSVALAGATIVLAAAQGEWAATRALASRPLRSIGRVSYGLYLWHAPVFVAVRRYCHSWPLLPQVLLALAITAAFTLASWLLVEVPFLGLKNRVRTAPA